MIQRRVLTGPLDRTIVSAASGWVQQLGEDLDLEHADRYRLELCVEELVTNIVKYGMATGEGTPVRLVADVQEDRVLLTIVDRSAPFDPLRYEAAPIPDSIMDLEIGGRGIQLVREFSDEARYEHSDDGNRLSLEFALAAPARTPGRPEGLDRVDLFRDVPESTVDAVLGTVTLLDVAGDMLILQRGDDGEAVLLVLSGEVRVHLDSPDGEEAISVAAGECVGEMSVIDDLPVSAYVRALAGTRLLVVDAATFLDRVLAVPRVARNLISAQAERTRRNDGLAIERMRRLMAMEQARREMEFARDIQASLLPAKPLFAGDPRLDCVGRMRPARDVGGDFYDAFLVDDTHVLLIVADVCGKGLPAALFMVRAIASLRARSRHEVVTTDHVREVMASLNEQLCDHNDARQFLTAFCGLLDLESLRLDYVNAGHNPPLISVDGEPYAFLREPINPPIGMVPGLTYAPGAMQLSPGARLVIYTDGVTEAEDAEGRMLGEERLVERLHGLTEAAPDALVDVVFGDIEAFAGAAPQSDDITVLAVACGAGGKRRN